MKRIGFLLILLLVMLVPSSLALAAPGYDQVIKEGETVTRDITLWDEDLTIEAGGILDGDVTVFDGTVEIAGIVRGDVSVFGGKVTVDGSVDGDVVVFSGDLEVGEGAQITGDCANVGGSVEDRSGGASCANPAFDPAGLLDAVPRFSPPELPQVEGPPALADRVGGIFLTISEIIGRSLLFGVLALVVTAVFPRQLRQVSYTVRRRPAASGAVGLLTAVAGPSLILLLLLVLLLTCVGLILYPAVFLLALALVAAAIFGWIAIGDILGRLLVNVLSIRNDNLMVTAALGTATLTLVLGILDRLPFIWGEGVVVALLALVGLGAAALTQFGTKSYPPGEVPPDDHHEKVDRVLKTMPEGEQGTV
jgi:cytoskeletal protein CcmA (bactofilin family)